ncbi:hypothetical protein ACFSHP_20740 [Novosphingobium panipatense]
MVKRFHKAGIEVIMDVVYNHTAEGSEKGPTSASEGWTMPATTCSARKTRGSASTTRARATPFGRAPDGHADGARQPALWVQVMHVDGFRFDLASTLGREGHGFDREGGFDAIRQDPILSGVKLIAEPWDIGMGGYQVGGFPHPFREWNDKFRDDVRAFWRGDEGW